MNKKLFYAALALPMMFAACSQEELFVENNGGMEAPGVQGVKLDLVTTKGDVDENTRTTWSGSAFSWIPGDKVSVYWLANQTGETALEGNFNSVYKTNDGVNFSSESLIYQGGNVAVYPANLAHTSIKGIEIAIPAEQGTNVITTTPYISNRLNVDAKTWIENQKAGYDQPLFAPMKQAANVVVFDFTLKNTADLLANADFGFKVNSVSLVADKAAFATKASVIAGDRVVYKDGKATADFATTPATDGKEEKKDNNGKVTETHYAVDQVLKVSSMAEKTTLTATNIEIVDVEKGLYRATFVVLPTDAKTFAATSQIVIETTCGRIDMTTQEYDAATKNFVPVTALATKPADAKDWTAPANTGAITNTSSKAVMTIAEMVQNIVAYGRNTTGKFQGENAGKVFKLSFEADMANATLNDSKVYESKDIERYVSIYKAMKSNEVMNLILSTKATKASDEWTFKLTKDAVAAVNGCNTYGNKPNVPVTLEIGNVDGIMLTGGGAVYLDNANELMFPELFVLELDNSAAWTMDDNYSHTDVTKIVNNGTLTVNGTVTKNVQNSLTEELVNNGTLNIGGNGTLKVADKLTKNKTLNVAANQDLRFNVSNTAETALGGTINVAENAFFTVEKDITLYSAATINNSGIVASIAGNGGIVNEKGVINVKTDNAITYVQDNAAGTINLKNRDDEVKVQLEKGTIVYNYTAEDGEEFEYNTEDKFTKVVFKKDIIDELILDGTFSTIDMVFEGATTLSVVEAEIRDLTIAAGAHLMLLTPSGAYSNELIVDDLFNKGNITIGGTIYFNGSYDASKGVVRSVGDGAIVAAN